MRATSLVLLIAASLSWGAAVPSLCRGGEGERAEKARTPTSSIDVTSRPLAEIAPGTVVGAGAPKGWTNLVMISKARLGVGDVDAVSESAAKYSGTFLFTILANVKRSSPPPGADSDGEGRDKLSYYLDKVEVGGSLEGGGKTIVARSDQTFGHDLGYIGRKVFEQSEKLLATDFRQVARTRTMLVFDARAYVRYNGKHNRMIVRHAILVAPETGRLTTFVWLLGSNGKGGYAVAESTLQLLPEAFHEDRVMSVDGEKFTFGIPAADAFALARIPQGRAVRYTPKLTTLAAVRKFDPESVVQLEAELQTRYAPLAEQANATRTTRR